MEGWLYKRGKEPKPWAKRWFLLVDGRLSYFNSPDDTRGTPKRSVALTHPTSASVSADDARQLLVHVGAEAYTLRAETALDAVAWAKAFNAVGSPGPSYAAPAVPQAPPPAQPSNGAASSAFSFLHAAGSSAGGGGEPVGAAGSSHSALFDLLGGSNGVCGAPTVGLTSSGVERGHAGGAASGACASPSSGLLDLDGLVLSAAQTPPAATPAGLFDGLLGLGGTGPGGGGASGSRTPPARGTAVASAAPADRQLAAAAAAGAVKKKKIRVAKLPGQGNASPSEEGATPPPKPSVAPAPLKPALPTTLPSTPAGGASGAPLSFDGLVLSGSVAAPPPAPADQASVTPAQPPLPAARASRTAVAAARAPIEVAVPPAPLARRELPTPSDPAPSSAHTVEGFLSAGASRSGVHATPSATADDSGSSLTASDAEADDCLLYTSPSPRD